MDVFVTREGDRFVWDSEKAAVNLVKHGVNFNRALDVFFDPLHELLDASVPEEKRAAIVGLDQRSKNPIRGVCGSRGRGYQSDFCQAGWIYGKETV